MRAWLFIALAAVLGVSMPGVQAYRLAFNDPKGAVRTYRVDVKSKGSITMQGLGEPIPVTVTLQFVMRETVKDVGRDGVASIVDEITEGTVVAVAGDERMEQSLQGVRMTYKRAPSGNTRDVKIENIPAGPLAEMQGLRLDEMMRQVSEAAQFAFPAEDLAIGDQWETTSDMPVGPSVAAVKLPMVIILLLQ